MLHARFPIESKGGLLQPSSWLGQTSWNQDMIWLMSTDAKINGRNSKRKPSKWQNVCTKMKPMVHHKSLNSPIWPWGLFRRWMTPLNTNGHKQNALKKTRSSMLFSVCAAPGVWLGSRHNEDGDSTFTEEEKFPFFYEPAVAPMRW